MTHKLHATRQLLHTPFGHLAVFTSTPSIPLPNLSQTLLLIHGNSSSSLVFRHIFNSSLTTRYRLIAIDLPGHGESSDADAEGVEKPVGVEEAYTMPGYARAAVEVLRQLEVEEVVVLGWSLGGHVGIEMMALLPASKMTGLMIIGSPPVPRGRPDLGFYPSNAQVDAAAKEHLTEEEVHNFSHNTVGPPYEPWMLDNVVRTDGRARRIMFGGFWDGKGVDQKEVVERNEDVLLAVVNGADEPFVNVRWVREEVRYGSLWKNRCVELPGQGHAPFWERPEPFMEIVAEFLQKCSRS